jgi:phage shock protein E
MQTSLWLTSGLFLVGITAVLAIWFLWTHPKPRPVTAHEARAELHNGAIDYVIDVRTQNEWSTGHYPHAIHIPLADLAKELPRHISDRSKPLLFYCRTGSRAADAAAIAEDLGYTRIQYLVESDHTGLTPTYNILNV